MICSNGRTKEWIPFDSNQPRATYLACLVAWLLLFCSHWLSRWARRSRQVLQCQSAQWPHHGQPLCQPAAAAPSETRLSVHHFQLTKLTNFLCWELASLLLYFSLLLLRSTSLHFTKATGSITFTYTYRRFCVYLYHLSLWLSLALQYQNINTTNPSSNPSSNCYQAIITFYLIPL